MTPTGKINRRVLPEPAQARPALDTLFVVPRSHLARRLAELWQQIFNLDDVGVYDNCFELGGESLLVTQPLSRIREVFQVNVPVALFLMRQPLSSWQIASWDWS
jgi:hypothetical protein